jgi:hypothetical protein
MMRKVMATVRNMKAMKKTIAMAAVLSRCGG